MNFRDSAAPAHSLIRKLWHARSLIEDDIDVLTANLGGSARVGAGVDLIQEGEAPHYVHLVTDGIACRYKMTAGGGRAILALLIPGDFCDLHVAILGAMDHSISTITECDIVRIPPEAIDALTSSAPRIAKALWWATLVDEAVLRQWLTNVGRLDASRCLGHLLCELYHRFQAVDRLSDHRFPLPLTQDLVADALGITPAYVNRLIQGLREDGLLTLQGRTARIPDIGRLERSCGFDPSYLHLGRGPVAPFG